MNEELFLIESWTSYLIVLSFVLYVLYIFFGTLLSNSKRRMKRRGGA
jgi:hypothetical protein